MMEGTPSMPSVGIQTGVSAEFPEMWDRDIGEEEASMRLIAAAGHSSALRCVLRPPLFEVPCLLFV